MVRLLVLYTFLALGIYGEELLDVHLWLSDPYAALYDLKTFVVVGNKGNRSYTGVDCTSKRYNINRGKPYVVLYHLPGNSISSLNSMSKIHEVLLQDNYYPSTGKLECSVSSDISKSVTTVVSAIHLKPGRRWQPRNGRFTVFAYPGTNIILNVTSREGSDEPSWYFIGSGGFSGNYGAGRRNGLSYILTSLREGNQGTYLYVLCKNLNCEDDYDFSMTELIVYDCPAGRWGPPSCLGVCDPCYNGGICHDLSGSCICPSGFIGKNCLQACGEHRFGPDCDITCGVDQGLYVSCAGSQICRPDPYGCNCLSGYTGIYCNESCQTGQYGVDCLQDCHCVGGSACDIYSGECPGDCQDGWSGPSCQVSEVCHEGFYGEYCGKVCHCLGYTSCDRETGFCDISDGICAIGYVSEPSKSTFCDVYAGCFDSCSKTCNCSEGAADCNSVTGECYSSNNGWVGTDAGLNGWTGTISHISIDHVTGGQTTMTMEPGRSTTTKPAARSGVSVPWAIFGATFVLFFACGGGFLGLWVSRRTTLTSPASDHASSKKSSSTKASSRTGTSSPSDVLYENPTFSRERSTNEHTYQGLNKGPIIPGGHFFQRQMDYHEYAEIRDNPYASAYELDRKTNAQVNLSGSVGESEYTDTQADLSGCVRESEYTDTQVDLSGSVRESEYTDTQVDLSGSVRESEYTDTQVNLSGSVRGSEYTDTQFDLSAGSVRESEYTDTQVDIFASGDECPYTEFNVSEDVFVRDE